ncbi:shKT domain-containing protein [Caerostris darwini]|uniref:ShKT domain-containing protein n=1 Tax=Caerostris darwini TaxID=1538125 RepID=A0AAV4Q087_9ARAC|nr:shKT domain-containing protein [Caerostris darwini]
MEWLILLFLLRSFYVISGKDENFMPISPLSRENTLNKILETEQKDHSTHDILQDSVEEDDHEDFELYDIIVQSENVEDYSVDIYTDEQRQRFVDLHNIYRSNFTEPIVEAANMKMMEYNKTLEWSASEYVKLCTFKHGFAETDNMTWNTGQNVYMGSNQNIDWYIYLFYKEHKDWNYDTQKCKKSLPDEKKQISCRHFTQLMWGYTQHVGCARRSYCFPRRSRVIVSCHYQPGGNWQRSSIEMYRLGRPCTRSEMADGNLCYKNLTVDKRMCRDYNLDCECVLNCRNCATANVKNCRCDCKEGWDMKDCSLPCADSFILEHPKWPTVCRDILDHPDIYGKAGGCDGDLTLWYNCRKTCGKCLPVNQTSTPELHCCGGKTCERYSVLDPKTCECVKHCPTYGCLYDQMEANILRTKFAGLQISSGCTNLKSAQYFIILVAIIITLRKFIDEVLQS